jgi:hypothetical protein
MWLHFQRPGEARIDIHRVWEYHLWIERQEGGCREQQEASTAAGNQMVCKFEVRVQHIRASLFIAGHAAVALASRLLQNEDPNLVKRTHVCHLGIMRATYWPHTRCRAGWDADDNGRWCQLHCTC